MDSLVKEADELKTIYNRLQFCAGANFLDRWGVWFDELSRMEKYLKSGSRQLSELRALVFANFLRVSVEFPFVRMSIGNKVSIVVSNIVSSHGARTDGFLYVLQAFLLNYPRACSSWHEQMRSFVFSKFTSTFSEVRKTAALTFALLPRCKYSKKDAGPCLAWFSQMMRTVATIHDVAVTLTVNDHTNSCMLNLPENVERFPIDASSVDFTDLCRIIESLLWSAVHMLSLEFMSVVDVPSNSIIHLFACLCELFWLRSSVCSDLIVTFLEPCFVLLSRTVRLLKIEFVPLCRPMVDLLFSLLNADAPSDGAYIFLLRRYVYDVLSTVCSVLGACSKLQDRFADLMPLIKKELQLGMTISHPKSEPVKKSKRQRKALGVTDSVLDQAVEKCFSLTCAVDTAVSCCDMLDQALLHFGNAIDSALYRELQLFVCRLLMNFCQSEKCTEMFPWKMPNMRCALYRLLTRFVLVSNAGCPSPIQCAETMFLTGQQDACPNVSRICHDGYSICQRLAKPSVPYSEPLVYRKENIEWHSMDNDESTSLKPTPDAGDSGFNDDNKKTPTEADAKCIFEENEGSHQEVAAQGACDEFQGEETLRLNDRPVADVEDGTDLVLLDKVMRTSGFENHELCRRKLQKKNFCPSDSMSVLYRPPLIDLCDSSPEFNVDPDNQSEQSSELGNTVLGNHKPPEKVESLLDCKSVSQSLESMLKDFVDAPPDKP